MDTQETEIVLKSKWKIRHSQWIVKYSYKPQPRKKNIHRQVTPNGKQSKYIDYKQQNSEWTMNLSHGKLLGKTARQMLVGTPAQGQKQEIVHCVSYTDNGNG